MECHYTCEVLAEVEITHQRQNGWNITEQRKNKQHSQLQNLVVWIC